jgi:hypothetical protein
MSRDTCRDGKQMGIWFGQGENPALIDQTRLDSA